MENICGKHTGDDDDDDCDTISNIALSRILPSGSKSVLTNWVAAIVAIKSQLGQRLFAQGSSTGRP